VNTSNKLVAMALVFATAAMPTLAHHSFAMFDDQKSATISGTVKEFQWTNPHVWLLVDVLDVSGQVVEWSFQGRATSSISRDGWERTALNPGDKVSVIFRPLKDGTSGGYLVSASVNGGNTFVNEQGHNPR
jgi:hypothetical protein